MDEVIKQSPEGIEKSVIKEVFERNGENVTKTLMELWEIKEKVENEINESQKKWNEIRETCDAFDSEMKVFIDNAKKNTIKL
jgi:chorismate synthase